MQDAMKDAYGIRRIRVDIWYPLHLDTVDVAAQCHVSWNLHGDAEAEDLCVGGERLSRQS